MARLEFVATADGAEARRGGEVVASLRGELREHEVLGRQAWIEADGDPAAFPDLYALAAAPWVDRGYLAHQVEVAAGDTAASDAWFGLCFGRQQVYAETPVRACDTVSLARVRPGTLADVLALGDLIAEAQLAAPVWAGFPPRGEDELRRIWAEELSAPDVHYLVADLDGRPAGYVLLHHVDAETADLSVQATRPELRGRGVGLALFAAATAWARARGHTRLSADWRSTNLVAARFWTARGFVPTRYRLHRLVGR